MQKWFLALKWVFTFVAVWSFEMLFVFKDVYLETHLLVAVSTLAAWFAWGVEMYYED